MMLNLVDSSTRLSCEKRRSIGFGTRLCRNWLISVRTPHIEHPSYGYRKLEQRLKNF